MHLTSVTECDIESELQQKLCCVVCHYELVILSTSRQMTLFACSCRFGFQFYKVTLSEQLEVNSPILSVSSTDSSVGKSGDGLHLFLLLYSSGMPRLRFFKQTCNRPDFGLLTKRVFYINKQNGNKSNSSIEPRIALLKNKLVFPLLKITCPQPDWRRQQKGTQKNECVVEIILHMTYQKRKQLLQNPLYYLLLSTLCKFDNSLQT